MENMGTFWRTQVVMYIMGYTGTRVHYGVLVYIANVHKVACVNSNKTLDTSSATPPKPAKRHGAIGITVTALICVISMTSKSMSRESV